MSVKWFEAEGYSSEKRWFDDATDVKEIISYASNDEKRINNILKYATFGLINIEPTRKIIAYILKSGKIILNKFDYYSSFKESSRDELLATLVDYKPQDLETTSAWLNSREKYLNSLRG